MNKLDEIITYVQAQLVTEVTAHDFAHSLRVMKLASYIGKKMESEVDIEIIRVAGITHDIIDKKVAKDIGKAMSELEMKLLETGYTSEQVSHIFDIIQNISFSGGNIPKSLEGKIVQDADRLDAIGAISIARVFAYGGSLNRLIYAEGDQESGIAHFYDKLLLLKDKMNTDIGKELAKSRHEFMENYLLQFFKEWNLEDIDL